MLQSNSISFALHFDMTFPHSVFLPHVVLHRQWLFSLFPNAQKKSNIHSKKKKGKSNDTKKKEIKNSARLRNMNFPSLASNQGLLLDYRAIDVSLAAFLFFAGFSVAVAPPPPLAASPPSSSFFRFPPFFFFGGPSGCWVV
jgi:hypothetical protein